MYKKLFAIIFCAVTAFMTNQMYGNNTITPDDYNVENVGLPILYIQTIDCEEPTFEEVSHPEGMCGYGITNATKVPGKIVLKDGLGGVIYDSGEYIEGVSGMTVRVRGNTSAYDNQGNGKKPYKLKLQKKADLLKRGDDNKYSDKDWVLIKDERLKSKIGFKVNELMNMQWTPQYMYVNVVMNKDFKGVYMLMESVKRNPRCRLDVSSNGFLFELDPYWWNENLYIESTVTDFMNYTMKFPNTDDISESKMAYFKNMTFEMEQSVYNGTYEKHIDVESFANWILAHDVLGGTDGAGSNLFLTKYDDADTSKVKMANLWDFDTMLSAKGWDENHDRHYFGPLFKSNNKSFVDAYTTKWNEIKHVLFDELDEYLSEYTYSKEIEALDKSILLNNSRWGTAYPLASESVNKAREWLANRKELLDKMINDSYMSTNISGAVISNCENAPISTTFYSLDGRIIQNPKNGVFIKKFKNGRQTKAKKDIK